MLGGGWGRRIVGGRGDGALEGGAEEAAAGAAAAAGARPPTAGAGTDDESAEGGAELAMMENGGGGRGSKVVVGLQNEVASATERRRVGERASCSCRRDADEVGPQHLPTAS